ncbi:flagellar basal body protein [Jannaschia aquimarina]|uniref:Flagellar basal body rod protein FlgB n=1 Tax=Jannaschia aquimarina TaxID=935700 RepID=A0A0D1D2H9_9RHOB|nr:flagellar basal body protein [Jannaschia aquimarina]KIT14303.1 flagellar basal body rod protein FlgB [Jannaschia aquimarina]SNS50437.1 flagellar basal-body rod protein FlgB [Jannaschia aquimarina]
MQMPALMTLAAQAAQHAGSRQALTARNVANADTPGYRPSDLAPFRPEDRFAPRATRPGHMSGATPHRDIIDVSSTLKANGNAVDLEEEILRGVEAQRRHDRAITVYRASMDILRTAMGRGR